MSHEIHDARRIRFPREVLPLALAAAPAALGLRVAPAEIVTIVVDAHDPPSLRVTFRVHPASPPEECSVSAAGLAAALIAYCRHIRLPISRLARKSVALEDRGVVLSTDYRRQLEFASIWRQPA